MRLLTFGRLVAEARTGRLRRLASRLCLLPCEVIGYRLYLRSVLYRIVMGEIVRREMCALHPDGRFHRSR